MLWVAKERRRIEATEVFIGREKGLKKTELICVGCVLRILFTTYSVVQVIVDQLRLGPRKSADFKITIPYALKQNE